METQNDWWACWSLLANGGRDWIQTRESGLGALLSTPVLYPLYYTNTQKCIQTHNLVSVQKRWTDMVYEEIHSINNYIKKLQPFWNERNKTHSVSFFKLAKMTKCEKVQFYKGVGKQTHFPWLLAQTDWWKLSGGRFGWRLWEFGNYSSFPFHAGIPVFWKYLKK